MTHPSEVKIMGMYVYPLGGKPQIFNWSHPDMVVSDVALQDIKLHPESLVYDKKALVYNGFTDGIDLNSYLNFHTDQTIASVNFYSKTMDHFYQRYRHHSEVNKIIPLSKLVEFAHGITEYILAYYTNKPINTAGDCVKFCTDFFDTFHTIETYDIPIDDTTHKQNYMWHTATSRPSNTWDSFNIAALNKTDGTRDRIHSKFEGGMLVQYDYDAFHVKLLAKIVGYEFEKHPYDQLKEDLNLDATYDEVKAMVFQNLYGFITPEFKAHPFFAKVQVLIDQLYYKYKTDGYISSYLYGRRFTDIANPSPNKVFNYYLQSMETEYNLNTLKSILPMLAGQKTVLGMYLYDAFVFDVPPEEDWLISTIHQKLEMDGMTVKLSIGETFGSMNKSLFDIYFKED